MRKMFPAASVAMVLFALLAIQPICAAKAETNSEWLLEIWVHDETQSCISFMLSRNAAAPSGYWEPRGHLFRYQGLALEPVARHLFAPGDELTIEQIIDRVHGRGELLVVVAERGLAGDLDADLEVGIRTITNIDAGTTWVAGHLESFVPVDVSTICTGDDYDGFQLPPGATYLKVWLIPGPPGDCIVQAVMNYRFEGGYRKMQRSLLLSTKSPRMWP